MAGYRGRNPVCLISYGTLEFDSYQALGRGWQGDSPCDAPHSPEALVLAGHGYLGSIVGRHEASVPTSLPYD